jgi:hypothetical protein
MVGSVAPGGQGCLEIRWIVGVHDLIVRAPFDLLPGLRLDGLGELFPLFGSHHSDITCLHQSDGSLKNG